MNNLWIVLLAYLVPVICLAGVMWAAHWLVTRKDQNVKPLVSSAAEYTPRQLLDRQLARGELTSEQYYRKRAELERRSDYS